MNFYLKWNGSSFEPTDWRAEIAREPVIDLDAIVASPWLTRRERRRLAREGTRNRWNARRVDQWRAPKSLSFEHRVWLAHLYRVHDYAVYLYLPDGVRPGPEHERALMKCYDRR